MNGLKEIKTNPFLRTQTIILAIELLIMITTLIIFGKWALFLIFLLPFSEEYRVRNSYKLTKMFFPKEVKE